jgi:hypothetical protein
MSRSRKHTPISGHTNARSEKRDKRAANRKLRRRIRATMQANPETESLPELRELSDVWGMDKDGKHYFDADEYPTLMRK